MKVPISKDLADRLSTPCLAITAVGLYDLYSSGEKHLFQNVLLIILFGVPTIVLAWWFFDKRIEFKDNAKVRKKEMTFQLPFSDSSTFIIMLIAFLFLVCGFAMFVGDKNYSTGIFMTLFSLTVIVLLSRAIDNPKIWFRDTFSMADIIEEAKNIPKEETHGYQDGIFSYGEDFFTFQIDKTKETKKWEEITLIKAYKVDLITVDSIMFEIHFPDTYFTFSDDTVGYAKFMDIAAEKLANFKKDWFMVVAFPAFEKNLTIIYEREPLKAL